MVCPLCVAASSSEVMHEMTNSVICWFIDSLIHWFVDLLICWQIGSLIAVFQLWLFIRPGRSMPASPTTDSPSDRCAILPVIQWKSRCRFTSFRLELARQMVAVTGQNQSSTFLWSCVLGFAMCSVPLSSSGANIIALQSWWLERKEVVIWIFREHMKHCSWKFTPKLNKLLTIALLLMSCWW